MTGSELARCDEKERDIPSGHLSAVKKNNSYNKKIRPSLLSSVYYNQPGKCSRGRGKLLITVFQLALYTDMHITLSRRPSLLLVQIIIRIVELIIRMVVMKIMMIMSCAGSKTRMYRTVRRERGGWESQPPRTPLICS